MAEEKMEYAEEARRQMEEISFALKKWSPHENSPPTAECALVDLTTMEGRDFTVQLDRRGFQVVAGGDGAVTQVFETVFALMTSISPGYRSCFSSQLSAKLAHLATSGKEEQTDGPCTTSEH